MNEKIEEIERNFSEFVALLPVVVFETDLQGNLIYINDSGCKILGYSENELTGQNLLKFIAPGDHLRCLNTIKNVLTGRFLGDNEFVILKKDGTPINAFIQSAPFTDSGGKLMGLRGIVVDITRQKTFEGELQKSEAFNASLLENLPNPIIVFNPDHSIRYVNPSLEAITGYSGKELIGAKPPYPWWPEEKTSEYINEGDFSNQSRSNRYERLFQNKNKKTFWVNVRVNPLFEKNEIKGYISNWLDITLMKKAEERIRYQALLVDNVYDAIIATDLNHRITSWNKTAEKVFLFKEKEVLGKNAMDILPLVIVKGSHQDFKERLDTFGHAESEVILKRQDGAVLNFYSSCSRIIDSSGRFVGEVGIFHDITDEKKALESLQKLNTFNSSILENTPDPIIVFSPDTSIEYANPAFEKLTGFTASELLNLKIPFPWWPEEKVVEYLSDLHKIFAKKMDYVKIERLFRKKSGEPFIVAITPSEIRNPDGKLIHNISIWKDVTENKKNEAIIKDSEEKYRGLVNNLKLGIFRTLPGYRGAYIEFNKAMEEITGYTRKELLDIEVRDLYPNLEKDDPFGEEINTGEKTVTRELTLKKKDGSLINVAATATAVKDAHGKTIYIDGILEDTTGRKQMEARIIDLYQKEKQQREVLQEEAKTRGMFIDVLAHELRTPLTPILVSTDILRELTEGKSENISKRLVDNIYNGSNTLAKRLEELLDLARYSRGTFKLQITSVDLNKFFEDVIYRFKPILEDRKQKLINNLPANLPEAKIDTSRLEQVIINLLSNASKFTREGGTIKIRVTINESQLQIDVQDNGIGIPQESQERIFKPYHRVEQDRQQFPGLGLGLAVSKQIVEAHGGNIWLVSQPGQGSTFSFRIPV